jgi:molecular chaperone GrpE
MSNPKSHETEGAGPAESGAPEAAGEARLKSLEDENRSLYDQLLRLKAEFENFRKRVDRDRPQWERLGRERLLARLLPLYDVLLSAHDHVGRGGESSETARGLDLIFKEFTRLFESEGVKAIESVGKAYDFNVHEAIDFVETAEHPEGTVVSEVSRGYTLDGRVLRPSRVRIAKPPRPPEGADGPAGSD